MTFKRNALLLSFAADIVVAFLIFFYAMLSTLQPLGVAIKAMKDLLILLIAMQCSIVPLIRYIIVYRVANDCETYDSTTSSRERTKLLERIKQLPFINGILTGIYFVSIAITMSLTFSIKFNSPRDVSSIMFMELLSGAFFSSLFAYSVMNRVCGRYAIKLVKDGVDKAYAARKKIFGQSLWRQIGLYIIIPFLLITAITCTIIITGFLPLDNPALRPPHNLQIKRLLINSACNMVLLLCLIMLFFLRFYRSTRTMAGTLEKIRNSRLNTTDLLPTDLHDEIAYGQYLANETILLLQHTLSSASTIGTGITESSRQLISISNDTESTALEQSAATTEILSTMDSNNALSKNIEERIIHVAEIADKTVQDVSSGCQILQDSLANRQQIMDANNTTLDGIKELSGKVNSIWDIVNLINSLADQTKIIAFNTELEAASVQSDKQNFRNVATEIRRLANNIMDSTKEIKNSIGEIQNAVDMLVRFSQANTLQIQQGMKMAYSLEGSSQNINVSSRQNADAANEIKSLTSQQTTSFEQISKTLQQISISIQQFSLSTQTLIDTSKTLRENADKLGKINNATEEADD